jgi:hypothetical protein
MEEAIKRQLFELLEMDEEETAKVNQYFIDHKLSSLFCDYEILGLSASTCYKIETVKLLIEGDIYG